MKARRAFDAFDFGKSNDICVLVFLYTVTEETAVITAKTAMITPIIIAFFFMAVTPFRRRPAAAPSDLYRKPR